MEKRGRIGWREAGALAGVAVLAAIAFGPLEAAIVAALALLVFVLDRVSSRQSG